MTGEQQMGCGAKRPAGKPACRCGYLCALFFGLAALAAHAQVIIHEIHYDPDIKTEAVEFIELYNAGTQSVDLSGWSLADGVDFTFSAGTSLASGEYLVVAQDPSALFSKFGVSALGPWVGRLGNDQDEIELRNSLGQRMDAVEYQMGFPWPTVGDAPGPSIELIHPSFDNNLGGNWRSSAGTPSPGSINTVYATNAPPQIRQVRHSPEQPVSGEPVVITAKISDPSGVDSVTLLYQAVDPGGYITLTDAAYASDWTALVMHDDGMDGDAMAGDSIYSATLPGSVQTHRSLLRYRISAMDGLGMALTVPYADDPQPNFAYFCYDGIPAWQAAVQPGSTPVLDFGTNVMRRLPAIHLISKNSDVETATWFERYSGDHYKWKGTLVYDGKVYDHIRYRARGGVWRYAMVKNMWKFDFNRGHDLQMRDDYGTKFDATWRKLNLGACIQQGNYWHRGEQGLFESIGSRLFQLAGVPAFNTAFAQLRIIDDAQEASINQYEGDFWGLYLVTEQLDGRFLDENNLPDGNLYKMESGTGELNNLGPLGPADKSDLNYILNNYTGASDAWWTNHWHLDSYYAYQTIIQAIHHYDINAGKNFFYYNNPESGLWQVIPWDLDLTWANNMYEASWGGLNALASRILDAGASGNNLTLPGSTRPDFRIQFRNRIREIRDLLFNAEQAGQLIDEQAGLLRDPGAPLSFPDADRAMWDFNPKMDSSIYSSRLEKAGTGLFYQWPLEPSVSRNFEGGVQLMKNYVAERGAILDNLAADSAIPATPVISYTGTGGYPVNGLDFQCSAFSDPQGAGTFAAMEWRAGEVLDTNAPAYHPGERPPYEMTAVWESGELALFSAGMTLPADALKVGHAYRVRVRMKDSTGRWSRWSNPVQFITTESSHAAAMINQLRINELMYHPPGSSDYEFIEVRNIGTNTLDISGAAFTDGVDFNFPDGSTMAPGGHMLVIGTTNTAAFRGHYGLSGSIAIAGSFEGSLSNSGEELTLKTAPGGTEIASFEYGSSRHWPIAAAGAGHSMVPVIHEGQATGALDYPGNWRASAYIKGSPGAADPAPQASLVINEIAAHTDYSNPARPEYDSNDWIELYNPTPSAVSLSGWYLSDDPDDPAKWACPAVSIPSGGYLVFNEVDDFHQPISTGFGLDKAGEQVLLSHLPGFILDRVVDAVGFKGQENHRSLSLDEGYGYPTPLSQSAANAIPYDGLRILEVMYWPSPAGTNDNLRDEYIEIHNPTASNAVLQTGSEAWRIDGGVEYTFPEGTELESGDTLLVVSFDPADPVASNAFTAAYGLTGPLRLYGPWSGRLGNRSERVALEKPQLPDLPGDNYSWVVEDEMVYGNQNPWPTGPAGGSLALGRIDLNRSGLDPASWQAANPSPGSSDRDGDGMSDYEEWISGTDPDDPESVFRITGFSEGQLSWPSVSGRAYSIYWTADLHEPFVPIVTNLPYPQSNFTDSAAAGEPSGFYRLEVRNPGD